MRVSASLGNTSLVILHKSVLYESINHCAGLYRPYLHASEYWRNLYEHIKSAERFIYILGWDLNPSLLLIPGAPTLLDLLKEKADAGIMVKVGLWKGK